MMKSEKGYAGSNMARTRIQKRLQGSNQFRSKTRYLGLKANTWRDISILVSIFGLALVLLLLGKQEGLTQGQVISPVTAIYITPTPTVAPVVDPSAKDHPSKQEIEDYVRTIFGKDARVAIAVSHNECNPKHPHYPACVLHTDAEYSVGIFQINLYNKSHWIHAQKVPGKTMEEKIEWLKDPYHNTLIAFKIFKDSGFHPWTAYSSGNYLNDL